MLCRWLTVVWLVHLFDSYSCFVPFLAGCTAPIDTYLARPQGETGSLRRSLQRLIGQLDVQRDIKQCAALGTNGVVVTMSIRVVARTLNILPQFFDEPLLR